MLQLTRKITAPADMDTSGLSTLTLNFEQRSKSRLRTRLDDQRDAAVILSRGAQMLPGDLLKAESGEIIRVQAADENVSSVNSNDPLLLARACYHLGNRHVALQILPGELRYLHDHVLDELVILLGLKVAAKACAFEPESGAYGAHAHIHGHHH